MESPLSEKIEVRPLLGRLSGAAAYDEALLPDGSPRPHVAEFWRGLASLTAAELTRRKEQGDRLIRQNGVTYNVYGDPRGVDRPWELNPIPLVLSAEEWAELARGLEQRARLLDSILSDLYGEQSLLKSGLLPPELVLPSPSYLRPLFGHIPPGGVHLHLLGVDLARAPDGRFWALADRTQAPSGAGYALENRVVVSRLFPQLFRDCRVERLAPFFQNLRDCLAHLAPAGRERPRVVLLTPGPYNETYFEHAYLARYLGYTLVEGADLTVRDRTVYLKTVGGLERVDVILRRLDDAYTDPLSLRSDSALGIPGLVQAVRQGNVTVANALGSGLIESPALLAFLPLLCRHLLGEELALPSVATWWCGQPDELGYVLSNLEHLVIKSVFSGVSQLDPVFAGTLPKEERKALAERIRKEPRLYVGQEQVALSTAPVWNGSSLEPRHVSLRAFIARSGDGYTTMPGGLSRVSQLKDSLVVSMQRGGGSKDCWVLASGTPSTLSLLPALGGPAPIVRSGADLGSRAADNMFWLGRYVERAGLTARLLRAIVAGLVDNSALGSGAQLSVMLRVLEVTSELSRGTLTSMRSADLLPETRDSSPLAEQLLAFLAAPTEAYTLSSQIGSAFRAGSGVRERLSVDTWRVLALLQETVQGFTSGLELQDALEGIDRLVLAFSAFDGLCAENMVRGPSWRFADIGRRIERALHGSVVLRTLLVAAKDSSDFDTILEMADSSITYRARYGGHAAFEPLLDLLLLDETNPRSVVFQLAALEGHVAALPAVATNDAVSPASCLALSVLGSVREADRSELCRMDPSGQRERLDELLAGIEQELPQLSEQLTLSYMVHAAPSVSFGNPAPSNASNGRS